MPIRTAILGYGRSGSTLHANPLEKLKEFDVIAVCDIDAKAKQAAGERFHCPIYDDYHEMLKKETPELVVIVTRSSQHAQMAIDCLLAGSNVLVTKPWATNINEAEKMAAAAAISGKKLLPWLPARWGSDITRIKEIIARGDIGRVYQIRRSEYTFGLRFDWQTERKYGGGYLLNWGPHLIDQPLQLTDAPVKSVYGELKQIINPGDVEDVFRVISKTSDDVTVISEFAIACGNLPSWVIQGDRGTIIVHGNEMDIHKVKLPDNIDPTAYRNEVSIHAVHETLTGDRYGDSLEIYPHIAQAIRGETEYFVALESALRLSRVLDAARQSSKTGQAVFL